MEYVALDHIAVNVQDAERSLRFYCDVLGLAPERVDEFRRGDVAFPSVRVTADTVLDLFPPNLHVPSAKKERPRRSVAEGAPVAVQENLNHLCLVTSREGFQELQERLREHGVPVLVGPAPRWGARGQGTSVYVLDPDDNEVEVRYYDSAP